MVMFRDAIDKYIFNNCNFTVRLNEKVTFQYMQLKTVVLLCMVMFRDAFDKYIFNNCNFTVRLNEKVSFQY